jgi:hypothetical protein
MHAITTVLVDTLAATLLVLAATIVVKSCLMHAITALLDTLAATPTLTLLDTLAATLLVLAATLVVKSCLMHAITALLVLVDTLAATLLVLVATLGVKSFSCTPSQRCWRGWRHEKSVDVDNLMRRLCSPHPWCSEEPSKPSLSDLVCSA